MECPIESPNFQSYDAEKGWQIPQYQYNRPDKLMWGASKSRDFSVRSAYLLKLSHKGTISALPSSSRRNHQLWKSIWTLKIPHKICFFFGELLAIFCLLCRI